MAFSTKTIRRRIRSIKNTRKVTKAMEMVAASKMRRAINSVTLSRAYSNAAWQAILNLAKRADREKHPLLHAREKVEKVLAIMITSNRGLCGGFNTHIQSLALKHADQKSASVDWVVVGKKGGEFLARNKKNIIATFPKPEVIAGMADISAIIKMAIGGYIAEQYDEVLLIYTDFISVMTQKPRLKKLLPFEPEIDLELGSVSEKNKDKEFVYNEEYIFEPSPDAVLDLFLKKMIEVQFFQAFLESAASEHSARMMAMRQATEAAEDTVNELTLIYNQARQAAITKELAEIAGGKAVLEQ